jgi:hypothetical protein
MTRPGIRRSSAALPCFSRIAKAKPESVLRGTANLDRLFSQEKACLAEFDA